MTDLSVPGKKVVKLICVAVGGTTKQSNKFYNMFEQNDGTFIACWGRIEGRVDQKPYPMSKWDATYREKTQRKKDPYTDVTELYAQVEESSHDSKIDVVDDAQVRRIVSALQSYATNSVKQNYTISSKAVTQAMVDAAQKCVDEISKYLDEHDNQHTDVVDLNNLLLKLYHIIPRRMKDVRNHLCDEKNLNPHDVISKIVEDEQATLDVMAGQVALNVKDDQQSSAVATEKPKSLLDILGLTMRVATADEIATVKKLMGPNANQFKAAFAVSNLNTQGKFDKSLNSASDKKTELFWHGSRNQNWLNIISTGLLIRPSCAIHAGSMFGDGIYFADKAQKSIGYTSLRGSYWSHGSENVAYLALFSVHVGKQKNIHKHDSSCYKLSKANISKDGFDSVFAHGGADLRNNEYIVYDTNQCTISFLVEIGG